MVFLNRCIFRQDMEVSMGKCWIYYKGWNILRLSSGSWGVLMDSTYSNWSLKVFDSIDKALRWIDGN